MAITKENTIAEVLRTDRSTASIFTSFGMHCLGCPHATSETLARACATHGVNADELVKQLNQHVNKAQ